ncbi:MAG: YceI family protein [Acidimicrobiales bacterium]
MFTSRTQRVAAAAAVVVVILAAAGWWFFIRDDAPEEASIDDAQAAAEAERSGDDVDAEGSDGDGNGDEAAGTTIDGTWTIDARVGSFDDFSSAYVGYRVQEELATIGANEAVGRTPDVTGTVTIDGNEVTDGSFEADMTTLRSDQSLRDNQLRGRGLETDAFPTASFVLTEPVELPDDATSGDQITFTATGDLTLHGVTNAVTLDFDATFTDGIIAIVGQAPIALSDYDIEPPEGFSVVSVADEGTFEFQLFLSR